MEQDFSAVPASQLEQHPPVVTLHRKVASSALLNLHEPYSPAQRPRYVLKANPRPSSRKAKVTRR
jgi:hypothetical protein